MNFKKNNSTEEEDESKPKKKRLFKWKINDSFNPNNINFDQSRSGVTDLFIVNVGEQEVNYFLQLCDKNIFNIISTETNRYSSQHEKLRNTDWEDTHPR